MFSYAFNSLFQLIGVSLLKEVTPALLKAHEALLAANKLLETLRNLRGDGENNGDSISRECELDLVELGSVWQAPFYEIVLSSHDEVTEVGNAGLFLLAENVMLHFIAGF